MMVVMVVMVMVRMLVTTDGDNEGEIENSMWRRSLHQLLAATKPVISSLFKARKIPWRQRGYGGQLCRRSIVLIMV